MFGRRRLSCGASPDAVEAKMPKWEQTRRDVENESCEWFTEEVFGSWLEKRGFGGDEE